MTVDSEYLEFTEIRNTGKTKVWGIYSKTRGDMLGLIRWWAQWRQYVFDPAPETVFNVGCMADIQQFIKLQMDARR